MTDESNSILYQQITYIDIFPNKSHLPVFSSPAIESHLHRIPGLSKRFIYFNDDVFLGAYTKPEDFVTVSGSQKFHLSWEVPKCAPGCSDSWIGDGFCDRACNVSSCNYDYPDCVNSSSSNNFDHSGSARNSKTFCSKGCPDSWLGDKVCDIRCKVPDCAWDMGDCGINMVIENFPGSVLSNTNTALVNMNDFVNNTFSSVNFSEDDKDNNKKEGANTSLSLTDIHSGFSSESLMRKKKLPISLSIPIGTKAVYFNLSQLCFDDIKGNIEMIAANYSKNDMIHSAVLLKKHLILLVILYSEQDDAPVPPPLPHLIPFFLTGMNTLNNITSVLAFQLKIMPNLKEEFLWMGYPQGINSTINGYASSCEVPRNSISLFPPVHKVDISERPFSFEFINRKVEGIVLLASLSNKNRNVIDSVSSQDLNTRYIFVKYTVKLKGKIYKNIISLCEAVGSVSTTNFFFQKAYSINKDMNQSTCPISLNVMIEQQARLLTHDAIRTQYDPKSFVPRRNIAGNDITYFTLLVPLPKIWNSMQSSWIQTEIEIVTKNSSTSSIDDYNKFSLENSLENWNRIKSKKKDIDHFLAKKINSQIGCISASFLWGGLHKETLYTEFKNKTRRRQRRLSSEDTYAQSLIHVNRLYTKKFGSELRKVPAHMPHMIDRDTVAEMQLMWENEWDITSMNRFRSSKDMQYAFSYYYYSLNRYKILEMNIAQIIENEIDSNGDGEIDENEFRTLSFITKVDPKDLRMCIHNLTSNNNTHNNGTMDLKNIYETHQSSIKQIHIDAFNNLSRPTTDEVVQCNLVIEGIKENIDRKMKFQTHSTESDKIIAFEMISDNYTETASQLDSIRARRSKFICINDNMKNPSNALLQTLKDFFESYWPKPSPLELPNFKRNKVLRFN